MARYRNNGINYCVSHFFRGAFSLHLYAYCGVPTGFLEAHLGCTYTVIAVARYRNTGINKNVSRFFGGAFNLHLYGDCRCPTGNIGINKNVSLPAGATQILCSAPHWLPCVRGAGIASAMTEGLLIQIRAAAPHPVPRFLPQLPVGTPQSLYRHNAATPLKNLACSVKSTLNLTLN